ncbi:MAG TPA: methylated-DNA--[protein]-cysteine S-methyltransferase [Flavitalea sp.]|nr:methylated-DNA--[protein]-cysteine S-methyltransferase [Flavitalea sp.]
METQEKVDFERIASAIEFLKMNYTLQPRLEEVAEHVHLSPFHFQRLFTDWAGVSPKQFVQYLSVEHAKNLIRLKQATLFDTALETGLSGTGRLHDLFMKIEGMTPGEYKNGGESLQINYSFASSPFGNLIIASTGKGICYLAFADGGEETALLELRHQFSNAKFTNTTDQYQEDALKIFAQDWTQADKIRLHLRGTEFQLKVWQALLQVPMGSLVTYSGLAGRLGKPSASRAVGSAVGDNPIAFLIPCHRVITATGATGNYHWGATRKLAIIGWESARRENELVKVA